MLSETKPYQQNVTKSDDLGTVAAKNDAVESAFT
jgi:hypothetical protein